MLALLQQVALWLPVLLFLGFVWFLAYEVKALERMPLLRDPAVPPVIERIVYAAPVLDFIASVVAGFIVVSSSDTSIHRALLGLELAYCLFFLCVWLAAAVFLVEYTGGADQFLLRLAVKKIRFQSALEQPYRGIVPLDAAKTTHQFATDSTTHLDDRIREIESTFRAMVLKALQAGRFFDEVGAAIADHQTEIIENWEPPRQQATNIELGTANIALFTIDFYWFARNILCKEVLDAQTTRLFNEGDVDFLVMQALLKHGSKLPVDRAPGSSVDYAASPQILRVINEELAASGWKLQEISLTGFTWDIDLKSYAPRRLRLHIQPNPRAGWDREPAPADRVSATRVAPRAYGKPDSRVAIQNSPARAPGRQRAAGVTSALASRPRSQSHAATKVAPFGIDRKRVAITAIGVALVAGVARGAVQHH